LEEKLSSLEMNTFPLNFDDTIITVKKIQAEEFTSLHHELLPQMYYENKLLHIPDSRWKTILLGAGEEKAVFCVCDHNQRVFAVELLNERTYLNGRFVGGEYFFDLRIPNLSNVKFNSASEFGLTFTGRVRVREYVYGYEWGRFQFDPSKFTWLDSILTGWLQSALGQQFNHYRAHYKDVHDRNVLFEIRDRHAAGTWVIARDWNGKLSPMKIGLQPIDVR
jgi:hypothetical protein